MTPATDENPQETTDSLLSLLKEYAEKISKMSLRVQALQEEYARAKAPEKPGSSSRAIRHIELTFDGLRDGFFRLTAPINDLVRVSSQYVEHAKLSTGTRLELSLRLGELEAVTGELHRIVSWGLQA